MHKWYQIKAALSDPKSADIYIYGNIGDRWDENGVSNWMAWPEGNASGGVTAITTSRPDNYDGDAAVIAVAIGGGGVLEVSR